MTRNLAVPRFLGAILVLLGIGVLGATGAWLFAASRDALVEERDAKVAFVARGVSAKVAAAAAAPARNLAVTAESATLAAAGVEAMVRATLSEAGAVVLSSRSEVKAGDPVRGADGRIEVQASVRGTMDALQAGLYRLENGAPLVIVEALEVRRPEEAATEAAEAAPPLLAATVTMSAFWKRQPAEAARLPP